MGFAFGLALFQAALDLRSDAQKEANGAANSAKEKAVGVALPQKISGDHREDDRRDLKDTFHRLTRLAGDILETPAPEKCPNRGKQPADRPKYLRKYP